MSAVDVLFDPALASRICWTLLHSLWLIGTLAAAAWLVDWQLARQSAVVRYNLHALALALAIVVVPATFAWLGQANVVAVSPPVVNVSQNLPADLAVPAIQRSPDARPM